ncbi:RNA polymerase sigma-70 factor [Pedobacter sp.]|jgi:RNA polymerase sigma-70 factor (family 1)|uniref:RNA polymerase sigma factor n=1 Tax=Pedobacter sp. TaxID=1411316 RepID=UPI002BC9E567|nr:RNA polymerase sigma-70 factor [Pedobacter sp.]HWW39868.1 RNA polymerase sigma-70 factor [Pedobacter sp.]
MQEGFDEEDIKLRCSGGDRKAYAQLYTFYFKPLYRHVFLFLKSREASEEIVQDVFVKIWENRNILSAVQNLKPYLYRVTKNLLLDHLRRLQTENRIIKMVSPETEPIEDSTSDSIDHKDYIALSKEAISNLTEKRREIFLMRTEQDLSLDEIADKLSISKSVVKKQLYASIAFIREYMHKHGGISAGLLLALLKAL